MKKVLWSLGVVVVVLIGAVLIAPSFIDWNQYKGEIAQQAEKYTGRQLTIGGDIRATILPAPALIAENVELGNIKGAATPNMVSLDRLEVRVALVPLLTGEVRVQTVRLVKPVIELERTKDGRTNWSFEPPAAANGGGTGAGSGGGGDGTGGAVSGGGGPSFAVQNFRIVDGVVTYRDAEAGTTQKVDKINADFAAASLRGPFESKGTLDYQGQRLGFEVNVGDVIQGRTVPIGMRLDLGQGAAVANVSGTLLGLEDKTPRFKADIKVDGKDAAKMAHTLAGAAADGLPPFLAQPFSIETSITANADEVSAGNLVLGLGNLKTRGNARIKLGKVPDARIELAAESLDVDKLLAMRKPDVVPGSEPADGSGTPAASGQAAPAKKPTEAASSGGPSLPTNISGSVSLRVDALKYHGEIVRNAVLNAELAQGEVTLSQLSAQLPGATDVAAFGFFSEKSGAPKFDGNVEATASDLRAVLRWAGIRLDAVPADRLRQLKLKAEVHTTKAQTTIDKLQLQFDNSTVTGGAVIAHRARPSFGLGLTVDRIDLDAYLKKATAAAAAGKAATVPAAGSAAGGGTSQATPASAEANPFAALKLLASFDANLRLHVKRFVYGGHDGADLFGEAVLHGDSLDVKRLSIGRYAGISGELSGTLADLAGVPSASKLKIDVGGKNVGGLFDAIGMPPPLPAGTLGPTRLRAGIDGNLLKPTIDATLETLGGRFGVSGTVNVLPVDRRFDLTVSARHNDPASLFAAVSRRAYRPAGPLGPLDLTAAVVGNQNKLTIDSVQGKVGKLDLKGTGSVDLTGARPHVVADLTAGELVVDPFLPAERRASLGGGRLIPAVARPRGQGAGHVIRIATRDASRWSDEPIDLGVLGTVDADVKLIADAIRFQRYDLRKADIAGKLAAGSLSIDKLTGRIFDGDLTADAKLTAGNGNPMSGNVSLQNAQIEPALRAVRGINGAKGQMSASGTFKLSAASMRKLVGSLAGSGKLNMHDVDVEKGVTGSTLTGLFGMITAMNQLGGVIGGSGVRKGAGLADVSATFTAQNGVITTKDAAVDSNFGKATAAGDVDLPAWKLDFKGQIAMAPNVIAQAFGKSLQKEPVPFAITGSLDAPDYKLDTSKLALGAVPIPGADKLLQKVPEGARGIVEGILGGGKQQQPAPETKDSTQGSEPPPQQEPAPQQPRKITPKELLRDLFKAR